MHNSSVWTCMDCGKTQGGHRREPHQILCDCHGAAVCKKKVKREILTAALQILSTSNYEYYNYHFFFELLRC